MFTKLFPRFLVFATVVVIGLVVVIQSTSTAQPQPAREVERWQYVVKSGNSFDESLANTLGRDGWELVAVYPQQLGEFRAIYKRRG